MSRYQSEKAVATFIIILIIYSQNWIEVMIYNQQEFKVAQVQTNPEPEYFGQFSNDFSIERYLSLESLCFRQDSQMERIIYDSQPIQMELTYFSDPSPKKSKSVFHNFQKHLITLIKKFVHLQKNSLVYQPFGSIAYNLWHQFVGSGISNKKILNLLFGSSEAQNSELQLPTLSEEFSNFRKIFGKHPKQSIFAAQQLLRRRVVAQAKDLSKDFLRTNSNVGRFEDFFLYFQSFIEELERGPMTRRMTKSCKHKLMMQKHQSE